MHVYSHYLCKTRDCTHFTWVGLWLLTYIKPFSCHLFFDLLLRTYHLLFLESSFLDHHWTIYKQNFFWQYFFKKKCNWQHNLLIKKLTSISIGLALIISAFHPMQKKNCIVSGNKIMSKMQRSSPSPKLIS